MSPPNSRWSSLVFFSVLLHLSLAYLFPLSKETSSRTFSFFSFLFGFLFFFPFVFSFIISFLFKSFNPFSHFIKICLLHYNYLCNIRQPPNNFILNFENFYCFHQFEFWIWTVSNYCEDSNSNRDDVPWLAWDYCSKIIRALQISSTTRNLVPRFRR